MEDEELQAIVQNMIDANESEENIALVISSYKPTSLKKKEDTTSISTTPKASSVSEPSNGFLDMQKSVEAKSAPSIYSDFEKGKAQKAPTEKKQVTTSLDNVKKPFDVEDPFKSTKPISKKEQIPSKFKEGTMSWNLEKLKQNTPEIDQKAKEFTIASIVPNKKVDEIKQKVEEEFNQSGFLNNAGNVAKQGWNTFVDVIGYGGSEETKDTWKAETNPFKKEEESVREKIAKETQIAKNNKKPAPIYTQEQINEMVKARRIKKLIDSERQSQVRSFLEDQDKNYTQDEFGKTQRERMEIYKIQDLASLGEKDQENLKQQNIVLPALISSMNKLKDLKTKIDKKEALTPEEQELGKSEYQNYLQLSEQASVLKDDFTNNIDKIKSGKEALDLFKRDYSFGRHFKNLHASINDLAGGMAGFIDYALESSDYASDKLGIVRNPLSTLFKQDVTGAAQDIFEESKQMRSETAKPISVDDINGFDDFGSFAADMFVSQAPIFGMVALGGVGIAGLGVSSTGQKYEGMLEEMRPEPGKFVKNYSQEQLLGIPAVYGATETASALVDMYLLKNASKAYRSLSNPERQLFGEGVAKTIFKKTGQIVKAPIIEGIDESATQIGQNFADKFFGEDPDKSLLEGVKDAGVAGALMGVAISIAPMVVAQATKPFGVGDAIQKQARELMDFQSQLDKNDLSAESRKIIEEQLAKSKQSLEDLIKKQVKDMGSLSNAQFQEINRLEKTQANIKSKANDIKTDSALDITVKQQLLANLKAEFKANEQRRVDLLQRGASVQLERLEDDEVIRLKDKAQRELMKEQNPDGTKSIKLEDNEISKRALEIYKIEQLKQKIKENAETEVLTTETQQEAEVPQQPEAEKVETPADNNSKLDITKLEVNDNFGDITIGIVDKEKQSINAYEDAKGEVIRFKTKEEAQAKLAEIQAKPQEVSPVEYVVAPSVEKKKKSILKSDRDLLGNEKEEAMLSVEFDKELSVGDDLKIKGVNAPDYNANFRGYNQDGDIVVFNKETGNQSTIKRASRIEILNEKKPINGFPEAIQYAIENDLYQEWINEGKISKEDVINIIASAKLELPEFLKNEATPPTNTPADGNVRPTNDNVGEVRATEQEIPAKESVPSSVDGGEVKGDAKQDVNIDDVANFLNEQFGAKKPVEVKETPKQDKVEQAKGFVSLAVDKLTTSLKDFQGRAKEYSEQTYNRIINEAKEGVLNISSIPPIQVWKNPETGKFVILAGHSRTKAFSDLAQGKVKFADKYKKSDFEKVNTQIVEAETLAEAQKIAKESNQGAVQTEVDNAKYVRESLLPTFKNKNQAATKLRALYGKSWNTIYAYAHLNPKGKVMQLLGQVAESLDNVSNQRIKNIAQWVGNARAENPKLTEAHENEMFDYLLKNDKIQTGQEFSMLINNRVNGLTEFNVNEPLNFEQKVGRGSNEVEIVKEIQDLKSRDVAIKKQIKDLQAFGKNLNDTQRQQIKQLTAESIKINTVDIPNAQKKQKQARVADAEQFDIFSQINEQIENGNITPEQVEEFVNDDRKAEEIEPIVEVIESKAKSDKKVELEEAVAEVDAVLANEENKQSETFTLNGQDTFYHASNSKRQGRLIESNAPQFGTGVYFSTDKSIVEEEFGNKNTTEVKLNVQNPVYTNTKKWTEVEELAIEMADKDYGEKKGLTLDEDQGYFRYDKDNLSELAEIPSKFISDAAKKLGYDVIIDEGSTQYGDEIVVLDESKIIYPEDTTISEKQQRKDLANAEVDKIAQKIKDILPGIKDPDLKVQGFSQDQLIDLIASAVKNLIGAGIEINEAIRQVATSVKERFGVDVNVEDVKKIVDLKTETETIDIEINKPLPISENFSKSASTVPNSGEVGEYLSGKTIEKYTGEQPENDQTIQRVKLLDALRHGVNTIEIAKIEFGDQFVEKTLEFLENNNVSIEAKALTYISLENELNKQKLESPQDRSRIQKQLNLVRVKRQAFARSNSLALNMNRLQAFAKAGYDINEATDKMFSSKEKEARGKIEESIQANGDQINDEAVVIEEEGFVIQEPKTKRDKTAVKAEISDVIKKMRSDLIRAAKGQTLNVSIPYATQLKVATPHIIKLTKLFSELGGLKTKEIIDAVYEEIQAVFPSLKRKDVSDIVKEEYQQKIKSPRDVKMRDLVKQALIKAGYSREVKTKGEVKTYFDWKKLVGEEGSVDNIKNIVEQVLKEKGYSESQIIEMAELLKNEYEDLRASIIEKSIRELQNRNTIRPTANVKGIAKKLAELYNYGLFEENMSAYNNLLNSALGFDSLQQEQFNKLTEYGNALSILFGAESSLTNGKKLSELAVKTQANEINRQIKIILRNAQFKNAPIYFKVATIIRDFVNISLTSKLMSVKQIIENPMSGFTERQFQNIGNMFNVKENGDLKANRKKLSKYVYSDIVRNGGLFYGDVSNTLVSQSAVEDWLNKQSDNRIYHSVISALLGRAYLNGADSMNKALLTEKNFEYNLIKILTSDSNPEGKMSKDDAMKFVVEKLTGQNFTEAQKIASDLIEKVNLNAGKEIIPNNTENKFRFAMDIVKESLATGTELTLDQIEKAYNAGYKSAGFAIGHEANNPISLISNMGSARIEGLLDKAVKEKKWAEASMYSVLSTVVKGVINPFVGGSFNWMTLTLQKAGLDPVSVFADIVRKKDNPIDLSTQTGINNLQNALVRDTNLKNTYNRYLIGAGVSIIIASAAIGSGLDDDMESWLKKNEWARKYFNIISPPALLLLMSAKNQDLGDYLTKLLNVKVDNMDANVKILKSIDDENQSTLGAFGQIIGQPFDTPVPWRVFRDIDNIKRGVSGRPLVKSTFKTNGFWNGYFQGGLVDYSKLRPGENYKTKEKIQQIRQETQIYNEKVKQLAKDYINKKYSEKVLNEKINEIFSEEPLKIEKTKNIFKNKAKDEVLKKQVKDQFYIDLKRESNDEIKAIMMYDKFGDLNTLSGNKNAELTKNMNIINFNPSNEFWVEYYKLIESDKKFK